MNYFERAASLFGLGFMLILPAISSATAAETGAEAELNRAYADYFQAIATGKTSTPADIEQLRKRVLSPALAACAKGFSSAWDEHIDAAHVETEPLTEEERSWADDDRGKAAGAPESALVADAQESAGDASTAEAGSTTPAAPPQQAEALDGSQIDKEVSFKAQGSKTPAPRASAVAPPPASGSAPESKGDGKSDEGVNVIGFGAAKKSPPKK